MTRVGGDSVRFPKGVTGGTSVTGSTGASAAAPKRQLSLSSPAVLQSDRQTTAKKTGLQPSLGQPKMERASGGKTGKKRKPALKPKAQKSSPPPSSSSSAASSSAAPPQPQRRFDPRQGSPIFEFEGGKF
jgi:hypothetical protein